MSTTVDQKLDALSEELANDIDGKYRQLIDHRGGCQCFISPPCHACSEPLTLQEAEALGWIEDDPEPAPEPVRQPDIMEITRRFLR